MKLFIFSVDLKTCQCANLWLDPNWDMCVCVRARARVRMGTRTRVQRGLSTFGGLGQAM